MCVQTITSLSCAKCETRPRLDSSTTEPCAHALRSGRVCWTVDLRERIVEDIDCDVCRQPTTPVPFNPRPFGWAYIPDTVRVMPSYQGHRHPSPPLAGSADRTPFEEDHHPPRQPQRPNQRMSQLDKYVLDHYRPGAGLYEQPGHLYGPGGPLHPDLLYPRAAPPQYQMPELRPEDQFRTEDVPFRSPAVSISTFEREKLATGEQGDFQRAVFDQSRQENDLDEAKMAGFGHGRRVSALEGQNKAQFDPERRADWEQYPTGGKKKMMTPRRDTLISGPRPVDPYQGHHRGNQSTGQKPSFIGGGGGGKDKEVWVGDVKKVNGRLYEHRKKLKHWEQEGLQRQ